MRVADGLDRIDPELGAFITLDADRARRREAEDPGGRLRGLTVAVKDLIDTAGLRTTYGSPRHREHVPATTAPVVAALEREGAIVLGKTNLNEYAYGVSGYNPHYGLMRTPHDRSRTPGGSSGGSAIAVAAGVCDLGIGTDTSGSVRIPAGCCRVFGFKCAHAGAPLDGIHPLAPSYDSVGYLAATLEPIRRVLGIDAEPSAARIRDDAELPPFPAEAHWTLFRSETYAIHAEAARRHPQDYGDDLLVRLARPIGDVEAARATMARWRAAFTAAVGDALVVTPVLEGDAPLVDDVLRDYRDGTLTETHRLLTHTPLANALGWPALAVPTADGPRQLMGPPGSEAAILAAGAAMARANLGH
jgi:aspartyl-tRNA(Asn)/glutamyl-tRNA(Gln) amidotransferase subunit A